MPVNEAHRGQARLLNNTEVRYFKALLHYEAGWRDTTQTSEFTSVSEGRKEVIKAYVGRLVEDIRA